MKILIYGINFSPELTGIGKYTGEMASWLELSGHDIAVITAPPYYPKWQVSDGYSTKLYRFENKNDIDVVRCPLYVPKNPNTVSRLIHLLTFSFTSFFALCSKIF